MKSNSTQNTIIYLFLILYFPFLYFGMRNVSSFMKDGISAGLINYMGAFFNLVALFALFGKNGLPTSTFKKGFVFPLFGWLFLVFFNSLFTSDSIGRIFKNFNYASMWATHFLIYYNVARKHTLDEGKMVSVFSVLTILSSFLVVVLFNERNVAEGGVGVSSGLNSSYFVICLIPWVVLYPKKGIRLIIMSIAIVAVFLSMKRTALVVLALQLLIFFFFRKTKKGIFSKFVITGVFLTALLFVFVFVSNTYLDNGIQARFEMAENDDMGGRPLIWSVLLEKFNNSSVFYKLFGHGTDSFFQDGGIELSAHNDYLETLYDFGIIGALFLLLFVIGLVIKIKSVLRYNRDLGVSFFVGVIALIFTMFSSHLLFIHPCQVVFLSAICGYALGVSDKYETIKINQNEIVKENKELLSNVSI